MLKAVHNIYKQKSHEIENVVTKKCRWWFENLEISSNPLRRGPPTALLALALSRLGPAVLFFSHMEEAGTQLFSALWRGVTDGAFAELGDEGDALVRGLVTTSVLPASVGMTWEFIGGSNKILLWNRLFLSNTRVMVLRRKSKEIELFLINFPGTSGFCWRHIHRDMYWSALHFSRLNCTCRQQKK